MQPVRSPSLWHGRGRRALLAGFALLGSLRTARPQSADQSRDTPVLRPGLLIRRPFGAVEITTFSRSGAEDGLRFRIDFLIRNETSRPLQFNLFDFIRLVADGVPRAPVGSSSQPDSFGMTNLRPDSAEYADLSFSVRGRPHEVLLQFGSAAAGRSVVRWPD